MWKYEIIADAFTYANTDDERGGTLKLEKSAEELTREFLDKKRLRPEQIKISTSVQDINGTRHTTVHIWWVED